MASLYTFAKRRRLTSRDDFASVRLQGQTIRHPLWQVRYLPRDDTALVRLGIIVSKRHARLAVTRNRLKRVVRECFRYAFPNNRLGTGIDIVVIATTATAAADRDDRAACIQALQTIFVTIDARQTA